MTVALQCLGNWRWMTQVEETPLLHWLLDPKDIGGLAWSEATALAVQQVVGWLVLLAGGLTLWRPYAVVLGPLVILHTLITVAMWRIAEGYPLQITWIAPQMLALFPFATQIARICAPLGLLLLRRERGELSEDERRIDWAMQLLRWTIAVAFIAHGIEAVQLNPVFLDLLINSSQRLVGVSLSQATAETYLSIIGVIDIIVAFACVSFRWRSVLWWMALWGAATAVSRVIANGWDSSWHETLTRISHFGVPLAVALWWHLLKYRDTTTSTAEAGHGPASRSNQSVTAST